MASVPQYTDHPIKGQARPLDYAAIVIFSVIMRNIFILTALLCLCCAAQDQPAPRPTLQPRAAGTQASDDEVEAQFAKTAMATIQWEKASTAGMKADVQLIKKGDVNGKPAVQYRFKITGAPHNQSYTLMMWPITMPDPAVMMDGLAIAQDGTVGCPPNSTRSCAQRMKGGELQLSYVPGIGEIYRHALISDDKKSRIFFSFVPFPIVETDKSCSLEVVELKPGFGLVIIRGKGFQPGESVLLHMQSYQEIHDPTVKADAQGQFQAEYTPFVKARTTGVSDVSATGQRCAPKLSFNWGAGQ